MSEYGNGPQQAPVDGPTRVGHRPPSTAGAPGEGSTIGPYRIDRLLAEGGMGRVYAGTDTRLNRPVAIKLVLATMAQSADFLARFEREAAIMAKLDSPHVIAVYDHGNLDGVPYLVTQYAAGGDLARVLEQNGPMPGPLAADICAQVADALAAAHAVGVIHRDVKAANVLLRDDRMDRPHAYLGDFGVAHTDSSGLTQPGSVAGTWNYLAPERAAGDRGSSASDIYALGCLFYECLTGHPPYTGSDVEVALAHMQQPVPTLPGDDEFTVQANAVLARTLAKDPEQRPVTAIEVRDQFRLLSGNDHSFAAGPTVHTRSNGSRGKKIAIGATAAVLAVALVGGVAWWALGDDTDEPATENPTTATAVTNDVDGDGNGDLVLGAGLDNDGDSAIFTATAEDAFEQSTGKGFGLAQVVGDVNADGDADLVRVTGDSGSYQITTDAEGMPQGLIKIPRNHELQGVFVADVNGDGRDDVGVIGLAGGGSNSLDDPSEVTAKDGYTQRIFVALSQETDTWSWREQWFTGPFVGRIYSATLHAGDFDGDGDADLVLGERDAFESEDNVKQVLLSQDGGFVEEQVPDPESAMETSHTVLAADVDGDGSRELVNVLLVDDALTVEVFSLEDGNWVTDDWAVEGRGSANMTVRDAGVSDVDGDGDDDLLLVDYDLSTSGYTDSVNVLRADGGTLSVETWDAPGFAKVDTLLKLAGNVRDDNL